MNKLFTPKFFILILFIFIIILIYNFSLLFCDEKINDFFTKIQVKLANKKPDDKVVLVVIDDKSIDRISWPWKRSVFSDIFDFLDFESNAKAIVFQNVVVLQDSYNPESDDYFYKNLLKHNSLINSYILLNSSFAGEVLPPEYIKLFENKSNVVITDKRTIKPTVSYKGVIKLPKDFLINVKYLASSHIPEDKDTFVRNYMPVVPFNNNLFPSLALSAYSMYTGLNSFVLYDDYLCSSQGCHIFKMPVKIGKSKDYVGNTVYGILTRINWYRPDDNYYTHKTYSAIDVLDSYNAIKSGKEPKIDPVEFKDKIVIIGLNADKNVWEQLSETPVLKKQADIDVHASMISNMISNSFISLKKNDSTLFITVLFCLFIIFGFKNFKNNLIFTSLLSLIYLLYYIYEYQVNIYVPPFTPILTLYSCAVLKKIYSVITTDKTSEMIKHAMGKYISKDVMKNVMLNLDKLQLGGVRAVVSVLFVDIRNFTGISENLNPSDVTSILNEYFSTIEPIIGKYHGIINKYMGDGVLAIFGHPISNDNHAMDAILCSFEIIEKVKILKEKLISEGKPKIEIGIGINTGEVFAGNIGTEERLEYTVIGDNVNLAYRIEAFNRILKTQFLISEYTFEFVKDNIDVVKLSSVNIKGKSKPIDIYEVLKIKNNDD